MATGVDNGSPSQDDDAMLRGRCPGSPKSWQRPRTVPFVSILVMGAALTFTALAVLAVLMRSHPLTEAEPQAEKDWLERDGPEADVQYYRHYAAAGPRVDFTSQFTKLPNRTSMLFFSSMRDYRGRMDRFFYELVDVALQHPQLAVTVWGPGWAGYDLNRSESANVDGHWGCGHFDIVYMHTGNPAEIGDDATDKLGMTLRPCGRTLLVQELGDCHDDGCRRHGYNPYANITLSRYAFIPLELFHMNAGHRTPEPQMYAHNPDCATPALAYPVPFKAKSERAMLIGAVGKDWGLYPLRERLAQGIEAGTIEAVRLPHPGECPVCARGAVQGEARYVVETMGDVPDTYDPKALFTTQHRQLYASYIKHLQGTRICLFDASVVKKAIRKFMESFMAGCVVASDMPFEMEEDLAGTFIELKPSMTETEIDITIKAALANPAGLERMAGKALRLAHARFTCHHKLNRILQYAAEYRGGFRGYYFPFGFRIGCHSYAGAFTRPNSWC